MNLARNPRMPVGASGRGARPSEGRPPWPANFCALFVELLQIQLLFLQAFPNIALAVLSFFKGLQVQQGRFRYHQIFAPPISAKVPRAAHRARMAAVGTYHEFYKSESHISSANRCWL